MSQIPSLRDRQRATFVGWLVEVLTPYFVLRGAGRTPPRPGKLTVRCVQLLGETSMPFKVFVGVPPAVHPTDVVTRTLTVAVDNGDPTEAILDPVATEFELPARFEVGQTLTLALVDTDASGNDSAPSVGTFTVVDGDPPAQPGPLTIRTVQVFD